MKTCECMNCQRLYDTGICERCYQDLLEARDKAMEILREIAEAPSLGASHRHFMRYFHILEELGERIRKALE